LRSLVATAASGPLDVVLGSCSTNGLRRLLSSPTRRSSDLMEYTRFPWAAVEPLRATHYGSHRCLSSHWSLAYSICYCLNHSHFQHVHSITKIFNPTVTVSG